MSINRFSFVTVDKKLIDIPVSSVCADNFQGSYELTSHLINKGHTKITCFYLVNMSELYTVRNRFYGYCSALRDNGIGINYDFIVNSHYKLIFGKDQSTIYRILAETVKKLMQAEVTAVCAENDYAAIDIMNACSIYGIKIPQELSIAGFDNVSKCEFTNPKLTMVARDFNKTGDLAAKTLLYQIEDNDYECRHHVVPIKLHQRESVRELL